jgi:8-oxo-dGTP diphosphatase
MNYKKPSLTVDILIFDKKNNKNFILIKRKNNPFKGHWAIPGGFVDYGESVEDAATRESKEETMVDISLTELFNVYSEPNRDPRGHTVTIVFLAIGDINMKKPSSDALEAEIFSKDDIDDLKIAFDHGKILHDIFEKKTW